MVVGEEIILVISLTLASIQVADKLLNVFVADKDKNSILKMSRYCYRKVKRKIKNKEEHEDKSQLVDIEA
jgi:hypothetical protein